MGRRARRTAGDGLAPAGPMRRRSPSFVRGRGEVSTPRVQCCTARPAIALQNEVGVLAESRTCRRSGLARPSNGACTVAGSLSSDAY